MNTHEYRELLEKALREIKRLRQERETSQPMTSEPIAILSMACRFPGSMTPEQLWEVSRNGIDCISKVPSDRWDSEKYFDPIPGIPGKIVTEEGGFLRHIRGFDAAFFGISPREARSMDPQQRLLLELTWEAIERAGIAPDTLYGTPVGVFLGLSNLEYASLIRQTGDMDWIDSYYGTGNAASVAAGRIAYVFGFNGPAFVIDTACSSSLVAVHLAAASLRRNECSLAVVGGVNLMILPETSIHFSNARMLAIDGRCKPFSKQANGYGRAEGCGVVILKRLSDAIRDRDPIDAILLGSAINHDGRSAGLTAPNGPSQESVIQAALRDAGLESSEVQLIEAHGTGTPLGDPIEAGAIARVYGRGRAESQPVFVSTIKANIGHTESAAGIAGLIHACQCLKNRQVPPMLHMHTRSPHVPWKSLEFTNACAHLTSEEKPIRAAVSSFGFSGTNAHVILQEHREVANELLNEADSSSRSSAIQQLFLLSAKSPEALAHHASRYLEWLEANTTVEWADICFTLQVGRTHFAHRIAFKAATIAEAVDCLKAMVARESINLAYTDSVSKMFVDGKVVALPDAAIPKSARRICLPTYSFQHNDFWVVDSDSTESNVSNATRVKTLEVDVWELSESEWSEVNDHQIFGACVMPAVGWLELVSRSALKHIGPSFRMQSMVFTKMLVLATTERPSIQIRLTGTTLSDCGFVASMRNSTKQPAEANEEYVAGRICATENHAWLGGDLKMHQATVLMEADISALYERFEALGLQYGPEFRRLSQLWYDGNTALGHVTARLDDQHIVGDSQKRIGLLDSALQVVAGAVTNGELQVHDAMAFVPVGIQSVQWYQLDGRPAWSLAVLRPAAEDFGIEADVFVWSDTRQPMLQLLGVQFDGFSSAKKQSVNTLHRPPSATTSVVKEPTALTNASLLAMPIDARLEALERHLRQQLADELEISVEQILSHQPLSEFGLDSLMIFRMGMKMEAEFGFAMNSRALIQGLSLRELTESMLLKLENLITEEQPKATES